MQRTILYETSKDTKEVSATLSRLEEAYLKAHRRKLPAEILSLSVAGTRAKPIYQITAYYKPDQRAIVEFLQSHI